MVCCASFGTTSLAWAADDKPTAKDACDGSFLGFRPWYHGLAEGSDCKLVSICEKEGGCNSAGKEVSLSFFVWTAVLNVMFDISLAVGYIAVAMVIYSGYLYMMSQGDPGKMARGKKALSSAIIGLVISMGATVIVNTVKVVLHINDGDGWNQGDYTAEFLKDAFNWAYLAAGIVAVGFIVKNGIDYMTSTGDPGKTQKATRGVIVSVVGLVIVVLASVITSFVVSSIGGAM